MSDPSEPSPSTHPEAVGTLFIVGTPIGNLEDLTDRARRTLGEVGLVAAEDTRRTGRLLEGLGVSVAMLSLFEGNEAGRTEQVLARLNEGVDVALVSDAGMPLLSDPGERLVAACVAGGVEVRVVPGPSSMTAALAISGLPTGRVAFEGFLPRKGKARVERLTQLAGEPRTVVLFESPKRTGATLADLAEAFAAERPAAVARELTKLHEEVLRGTLGSLATDLTGADLKGEIVIVVGPAPAAEPDMDELVEEARALVDEGFRRRAAATRVAGDHSGASANEIYARLTEGGGAGSA